jgi:DNA-binding PadR family transcriptional regulator
MGYMASELQPSPLALTILGLLAFEPLHPYGMQRLIKQWGKDQVVNVGHRANLYKTIKRLHDAGLITVRNTERDQQYPERTVYELTDKGRQVPLQWLDSMLSKPRSEFPEFPAALSFAMMLGPQGAREALERRVIALSETVTALERELEAYAPSLPRVTLIETEYLRAVAVAELSWARGIIDDLRSGALSWSYEELGETAVSSS